MKTIYRRNGREVDEAEALDGDVLRDGYSLYVPTMFRDGTTVRRIRTEVRDPRGRLASTSLSEEEELDDGDVAALADAGVRFHDGYGRPAGHRPGFCIATDADMVRRRAAVRDAYAEVEERDRNAWRNPPQQPWAGAAALPAVLGLTADALQMLDEKERAYAEVAERDANAWRTVKP